MKENITTPYYALTVTEQNKLKVHPPAFDAEEYLHSLFKQLPERIIRHSERVCLLSGVIAEHLTDSQIPVFLDRKRYISTVSYGAYYHEIGIYNAGNIVRLRPNASGNLLAQYGLKSVMRASYTNIALETVQSCQEHYNGEGFPGGIKGDAIPIHAAICGIADAIDMIMSGKKLTEENVTNAIKFFAFNYGKYLLHPGALKCFELAQDEIIGLYASNGWHTLVPCPRKRKKNESELFDIREYSAGTS